MSLMQDTPRLLISMRSCAASRNARGRTQIANTNQFCRARKQMKINSAKKTKRHVYSLQASDVEYGNKTRRCEARRATSCVFLSSWSYRSLSSMEHCERHSTEGPLEKWYTVRLRRLMVSYSVCSISTKLVSTVKECSRRWHSASDG